MAKKLKVGVIGSGGIAQGTHLPAWQELEAEGRVELTALCDINESIVTAAAKKFGAKKTFTDYAKMLELEDFDIIDVCTPNKYHFPATIAAFEANANVLVEKPIAMNVAEAEKIIAASKSAGKVLMVAQHERFKAENEAIKAAIERGELGEIYTSTARYMRRRGIPGWGKFHIKEWSLGGPLIDLGVHCMDLCCWLMGFPKAVAASGKVYRKFGDRADLCNAAWGRPFSPKEFDVEDYAVAFVRFENDATMLLETSWAANIPEDYMGVSILGDKAGVSTNPAAIYGASENSLTTTKFDWVANQQPHRMEIRHFVECLEKDLPVRVKPSESLQIQKIIDAIYTSSEENREIIIR
ncbi:Gfo/Idh/MocA family oxidoreductase [bacterium]|nr:Gfo/Idh/MocA family oxidoreductase [bacterium]